jgi:pentalenolactone synthase
MTASIQLPFDQPHPLQPPSRLRELQADGPVHQVRTATGDAAWLVTGYPEVQQLFNDPRLGRSHPDPVNAARMGESALFGGPMGNYHTEETDHARMRALIQPLFSPRRMREFRPRVEALATALFDELATAEPPADLNETLALPLPILVICELLGVPYEERAKFRAWTQAVADTRDRERSQQGLISLFGYGQELVARKRAHPGDDVISRLCATKGVGDDEAAMLAMGLLFAGHETTVVAIGMGTLLLLSNPSQQQALRSNPDLLSAAIEEILRAPVRGGGGIPRYARADIEIGGVTVRAGELILLDHGAANHDESVFALADQFDITRQAAAHLTFGHGPRYCLGAPLARIELQTVFSQLLDRFPGLRLAVPVASLKMNRNILTGGLTQLPVTW